MNLGNRRYIYRRLRGGSSWWGGSSRAIQPSFTQLSEAQLDKVTIKSLHEGILSGFFRGGVVSSTCRMNEHDDPVRWCFVLVACSNRGPTRQSVCRSPRPSSPIQTLFLKYCGLGHAMASARIFSAQNEASYLKKHPERSTPRAHWAVKLREHFVLHSTAARSDGRGERATGRATRSQTDG